MNEAENVTVCTSMKHCSAFQPLTLSKDNFFLSQHVLSANFSDFKNIMKALTELNVYDYEVHHITIFKKHTIHTMTRNETKPFSILNP